MPRPKKTTAVIAEKICAETQTIEEPQQQPAAVPTQTVGDLVMARIIQTCDAGTLVWLIDYNVPALVPVGQSDRRSYPIGQTFPARVLDGGKQYCKVSLATSQVCSSEHTHVNMHKIAQLKKLLQAAEAKFFVST